MKTPVSILLAFLFLGNAADSAASYPAKPRLVVILVVDQLRADYLTKYRDAFLPSGTSAAPGGYRFLMEKGAYFPFAEYPLLQNMTCPGHATISTGALPYQHGIPLNGWMESSTGKKSYCVGDSEHPIVGAKSDSSGASPKNLIGTTIADQIKAHAPASRVYAVSLKDRGAILMGGHQADLALWFDWKNHAWVTSKYYAPTGVLPLWVKKLNDRISESKETPYTWKGIGKKPFERTVPKSEKAILQTAYGVDITTDAAISAMKTHGLGQGNGIDVLAISYSSHDYAGHQHGPDSAELEQMTLTEDRALAKLFREIQKYVPGGLSKTLIVLTGDHGVSPAPVTLKETRIENGRINGKKLLAELNLKLAERFGSVSTGEGWLIYQTELNFFLNHASIEERKKSRTELEDAVKSELLKVPGAAFVITRTEVERRALPPGQIERGTLAQYRHGRSGDIVLIPKPYYSQDTDPVVHMTHYAYDRQVPLLFYGAPFQGGIRHGDARIQDLAPTLAYVLGIIAPPASEGKVLFPALQ